MTRSPRRRARRVGGERLQPRAAALDPLGCSQDPALGEADADERVEGVEHLTGPGTTGLRQQGELEHGRVAVVADLDAAERGTDVVDALLALAGPGDGQLVARQRARRSGAEHRLRDGSAEAVDGLDPVLDLGDRFLQRGGPVDEPHRAGRGHALGQRRGEPFARARRCRRAR